jgi:hypothetical protein
LSIAHIHNAQCTMHNAEIKVVIVVVIVVVDVALVVAVAVVDTTRTATLSIKGHEKLEIIFKGHCLLHR